MDWQAPLTDPFAGRGRQRIEISGALRMDVGRGLEFLVGGGLGVLPGAGTPAVRPFLGLRYLPKPPPGPDPRLDPLGVPRSGT